PAGSTGTTCFARPIMPSTTPSELDATARWRTIRRSTETVPRCPGSGGRNAWRARRPALSAVIAGRRARGRRRARWEWGARRGPIGVLAHEDPLDGDLEHLAAQGPGDLLDPEDLVGHVARGALHADPALDLVLEPVRELRVRSGDDEERHPALGAGPRDVDHQ